MCPPLFRRRPCRLGNKALSPLPYLPLYPPLLRSLPPPPYPPLLPASPQNPFVLLQVLFLPLVQTPLASSHCNPLRVVPLLVIPVCMSLIIVLSPSKVLSTLAQSSSLCLVSSLVLRFSFHFIFTFTHARCLNAASLETCLLHFRCLNAASCIF